MKLSVIIPCLDYEFSSYVETLKYSVRTILNECRDFEIHVILMLQSSTSDFSANDCELTDFSNKLKEDLTSISVVHLQKCSVSLARNIGIDLSIENGCSHVYFHDISIVVSKEFAGNFPRMNNVIDYACSGSPKFSSFTLPLMPSNSSNINNYEPNFLKSISYPAFNPYVWTYIFPINMISDIRFCENIGPGSDTKIKSGEDYIFLSDVLRKSRFYSLRSKNKSFVYHPLRKKFGEKSLIYAKGQGFSAKAVFMKYKRPSDLLYIFLFIINSFFKIILMKQNSVRIFKDRIRGLLLSIDEL